MKSLKEKEIIIGLLVVIFLLMTVLVLIFQKYVLKADNNGNSVRVEQETIEETVSEESGDISYEMAQEQQSTDDTAAENGLLMSTTGETMTQTTRNSEKYVKASLNKVTNSDTQMAELYSYWKEYKLDSVGDLIRLERVRTITDSLKGTNSYYYFGDTNNKGLPEGTGLAIYEDNTYYFGEWKNGLREGSGMWIRIYPDQAGTVDGYSGVLEHQYSGNWKNDLPNGEGQEHFTYDTAQITNPATICNVMGEFKDGYYNSEMLIMLIDSDGETQDWYGTAKMGVFQYVNNNTNTAGTRAVWTRGSGMDTMDEEPFTIKESENYEWGISSLKK